MEAKDIKLTAVESLMEEAMLKCQYCRYQNICIELMRLNCIQGLIKGYNVETVKTNSHEDRL